MTVIQNKKKIKTQLTDRIADLSRSASRDVGNQLREILSRDIMTMPYTDFEARTKPCKELFRTFHTRYQKLRNDIREKRLNIFIFIFLLFLFFYLFLVSWK